MRKLKLGSLFDGLGGWPLAAVKFGVEPVWACEIETFPIEVTKVRFPNMKHLGSVTDVHGDEIEPVDIITSGSPCQDLSVAGKRAGLAGARSGLFTESIRIVREMRAATGGEYPTLSSNQNRDFLAVLQELSEADIPMPESGRWAGDGVVRGRSCDLAWRCLDAQYWGVPQRRNRIFLIRDFRNLGRSEILFERESVSGNHPKSRTTGQETATKPDDSSDEAGERPRSCLNPWDPQSKKIFPTSGKMQTLYAAGGGGGRGISIFSIAGNTIDRKPTNGGNGPGWHENVCYTLNTIDRHAVCFEPGSVARNAGPAGLSDKCSTLRAEMGDNQPAVLFMRERGGKPGGGKGPLISENMSLTLGTSNDQAVLCMGSQQANAGIMIDKSPTLTSAAGMSGNNQPIILTNDKNDL